mmetsp:Transcript_8555/g.13601  ORF Transcript_8555/g.13601 Transcript_8555/m.13601 type:complete len:295 (-) Transcript_8555:1689-2573(-)
MATAEGPLILRYPADAAQKGDTREHKTGAVYSPIELHAIAAPVSYPDGTVAAHSNGAVVAHLIVVVMRFVGVFPRCLQQVARGDPLEGGDVCVSNRLPMQLFHHRYTVILVNGVSDIRMIDIWMSVVWTRVVSMKVACITLVSILIVWIAHSSSVGSALCLVAHAFCLVAHAQLILHALVVQAFVGATSEALSCLGDKSALLSHHVSRCLILDLLYFNCRWVTSLAAWHALAAWCAHSGGPHFHFHFLQCIKYMSGAVIYGIKFCSVGHTVFKLHLRCPFSHLKLLFVEPHSVQ